MMTDLSAPTKPDGLAAPAPPVLTPSLRRRFGLLMVVVAACVLAYGLVLVRFDLSDRPVEIEFGAPLAGDVARVYLQPLNVDPVSASMQMRISLAAAPVPAAAAAGTGTADRLLKIQRGRQTEHVTISAGQPLPEVVFDFDLNGGDVRDYPLDRYRADMSIAVSEQRRDGTETPLPLHVALWEGLLGYRVKGLPAAADHPEAVGLSLEFQRTAAVSIFGIAIYGAMVIMAICSLLIGSLVFVGLRRIEAAFAGALGAIIFALPALRAALPGSPPLGVRGDVLTFFWAELGAIVALCLFVAAWVRSGSRP
jgi:hypothetical protein